MFIRRIEMAAAEKFINVQIERVFDASLLKRGFNHWLGVDRLFELLQQTSIYSIQLHTIYYRRNIPSFTINEFRKIWSKWLSWNYISLYFVCPWRSERSNKWNFLLIPLLTRNVLKYFFKFVFLLAGQ